MKQQMKLETINKFACRMPMLPLNSCRYNINYSKLVQDSNILEAIMTASYDLYERITAINNDPNFIYSKEFIGFIKYYNRMCTRCTPFGLLASSSIGHLGKTTTLPSPHQVIRKSRLDMYYVCMLIQMITTESEFRKQLIYYPNNTIYDTGDTYRYTMFEYEAGRRKHYISEFEKNPDIAYILSESEHGSSFNEIKTKLLKLQYQPEECEAYIECLIDNQVLISEVNPTVTGQDCFEHLIEVISNMSLSNMGEECRKRLLSISQHLKKLDQTTNADDRIRIYKQIVSIAEQFGLPFKKNQLIQVDTVCTKSDAVIGEDETNKIKELILFLFNFHEKTIPQNLQKFKSAFYNKYEGEEISLAIALDNDLGIGYPPQNGNSVFPLILNGLKTNSNNTPNNQVLLNKFQRIIISEIIKNPNAPEITLDNVEISHSTNSYEDIKSINVWLQLFHDKEGNIKIYTKGVTCNNPGKLIARFAHVDESINTYLNEVCRIEDNRDDKKIMAEVVHLPSSRVGNILSRPHISKNEIVYISDSDLPNDNKIKLSDIGVLIRNNKIILRSRNNGKEIQPRLTSAHNYMLDTSPAYKFLCDMQFSSGMDIFACETNVLFNIIDYIPRITYNGIILSPAKWRIDTSELLGYLKLADNEIMDKIDIWRVNNKIPGEIVLIQGDNELYVNLSNIHNILAFLSEIKHFKHAIISEFLYKDEMGTSYSNECLLCFKHSQL